MGISVIILTHNSAERIEQTIQCAKEVSDDIHVVDSFSEDNTEEVVRSLGVNFCQHEFIHYGAQRNWAMDNLELRHQWQLHLDSDERLSDALIAEINQLQSSFPHDVDGYFVPRLTVFFGKELRHGGLYPIWHLRLFKSGKGRCEQRVYDQHFYVDGKTKQLTSELIDDTATSLSEWISRHNRWATLEAQELSGMHGTENRIAADFSGTPAEQKRALRGWYYRMPLFVRPFMLFFYRYILRLGFLDGSKGFVYFVLQTFWYRFLIDAKLFELRLDEKATSNS